MVGVTGRAARQIKSVWITYWVKMRPKVEILLRQRVSYLLTRVFACLQRNPAASKGITWIFVKEERFLRGPHKLGLLRGINCIEIVCAKNCVGKSHLIWSFDPTCHIFNCRLTATSSTNENWSHFYRSFVISDFKSFIFTILVTYIFNRPKRDIKIVTS